MSDLFVCPKCNTPNFDNEHCSLCFGGFKEISGIPAILSKATSEFYGYTEKAELDEYSSQVPTQASDYYPRYIPEDSRLILDVGGGDGNALANYAQGNPNSKVFVCDADITNLVRVGRRGLDNLLPFCCQADLLPFGHESVDVVFSLFMVEHMDDYSYSRFLFRAFELLRPGGTLIIASDSPVYDKYIHPLERFARYRIWKTTGFLEKYDASKIKIHHFNLKQPTDAAQFISKHGFFVQDIKLHLIGGSSNPVALFYELLPSFCYDLFSTMYVVIAIKTKDEIQPVYTLAT